MTNLSSLNVAGVPTMGMSGIPPTLTNIWFVNSTTGSSGNPGTQQLPFAALANALSVAAAGDVIVLEAGHAETITAAAGINVNVAGVTIVGLGVGAQRPTFTFTTSTAATITMTAANVSMTNIIGTTTIDQIVSPFVVSAAGVTLGLTWNDQDATHEALRAVLTTAAANNFTLNLNYNGFTAGTHVVNAVRLVGGRNAAITVNFYGIVTTAVVEFATTATVDTQISGLFYVSGTTNLSKNVVDTITGSTWSVQGYDAAGGVSFDGGSGKAVASSDVSSISSVQEQVAFKAAATLVNAQTLFTVAGGPIAIIGLVSICVTGNDATASTLQYSATPTVGSAQTISAASASLASALAGASVTLAGTALATAALLNANGPNLIANPGTIMVPAGTIKAVVGVGSTTGTWAHYIRYKPLAAGVTVS